jgi:hypothetical protein
MKRSVACASLCLSLALACSGEKQPAAEAQPAPPAAPASAPAPATQDTRWIFSEFDWGDSEDVVYETIEYTDGFLCYRHQFFQHCAFVKTKIDGEELLAKFELPLKALTRADVLTPDLDEEQAALHLERVWKLLAAYTTRFFGEAPEQTAFPDRHALAPGELRVTHRWKLADQEIRLVVGRREGAESPLWFTALRCVDPKHADSEPAFRPDAPAQAPSTASPTS